MKRIAFLLLALCLLLSGCAAAGGESSADSSQADVSAAESSQASVSTDESSQAAISADESSQASVSTDESSQAAISADESSKEISNEESMTEKPEEFVPVFRMIVASDTHIANTSTVEAQRLKKMFASSYAYAAKSEYKTVDAAVFVGDLTNSGTEAELNAFKTLVTGAIKSETTLLTMMGNHEHYSGGIPAYKKVINTELDNHLVVGGFHLIGLSTSGDDNYTAAQQTWLSNELAAAAADSNGKPVFTFQHHHIRNTVYVSKEWYTNASPQLNKIYSSYAGTINFSGHSHGPINNPTSVFRQYYTLVGTGTLSYFEMESGMTYGTIPPSANQAAQFWIVEADSDGSVRLLPYNLLTDDFFDDPNGSGEKLVYEIDDVCDKTEQATADIKAASEAPKFASGAELKIDNISTSTASITIPQASDDDCVYSYSIVCSGGGKNITYNYFSEYYLEPMAKTITFALTGFSDGVDYEVSVTPVDCYGKRGEALTASFTTVKKAPSATKTVLFTDFEGFSSLALSSGNAAYGGSINGDYWVGDWCSASTASGGSAKLVSGKGLGGSKALAVSASSDENQGLYLFATKTNKLPTEFESTAYLRVWVDFTGVDFRKANFGLVAPGGALYTTDESDYAPDLFFYYKADGSDEWVTYEHGGDGCFGTEQNSSVKNFKGFLAFPVKDFTYRYGTGNGGTAGTSFPGEEIAGVYLFWDYDSSITPGAEFIIDDVRLMADYK